MLSSSSTLASGRVWRTALLVGCLLLLAGIAAMALPISVRALQPAEGIGGSGPSQVSGAKGAYGPPAQAQRHEPQRHGGPDDYGYVFDDETEPGGPVYLWVTATNRIPDAYWQRVRTVSSTTTLDDGVMTTTLPFSFNFYGSPYTQLHISTNGNVHFGAPNDWYPDMSA